MQEGSSGLTAVVREAAATWLTVGPRLARAIVDKRYARHPRSSLMLVKRPIDLRQAGVEWTYVAVQALGAVLRQANPGLCE